MRRATAWIVVVGVLANSVGFPTQARASDGFWVTLAAGAAGSSPPSDYSEFWFDSPHAPDIAVSKVTGEFTASAATGGGNTFFTGAGTPVLLPTSTGYATLTSQSGPTPGAGGLPRFAGGTQASGAPQPGMTTADASLLSVGLGEKNPDGSQVLSVGLTDPSGNPLGDGHVIVPDGGWWVIGLGQDANDLGTPVPGPIDQPVLVPVAPSLGGNGGSIATPEPASLALLGIGALTATGWRRLRRH